MTNNRRCGLLKLVSLRNASHSFSNAKPDSHLAATLTAKKSVSGFHTNIDDAVAFFIRLINEHRTPSQLELENFWQGGLVLMPYTILIDGFYNHGRHKTAEEVFNLLHNKGWRDVKAIDAMINGLCKD
ncbi:hypothetical protein AAHE18_12G065800 [Arachis hypogaea]